MINRSLLALLDLEGNLYCVDWDNRVLFAWVRNSPAFCANFLEMTGTLFPEEVN